MTAPIRIATDRFGLGAIPGETLPGDLRGWLTSQLRQFDPAPAALGSRTARMAELARILPTRVANNRLKREGNQAEQDAALASNRELGEDIRRAHAEAVLARLRVATASATPFAERLVHFWSNHFSVSMQKVLVGSFVADFEFSAVRPHVMGNFRDLLRSAVLHPAMLQYLDQNISIGPSSPLAGRYRRLQGLNENLGREVLELHTLGAGGGYSQADVTELALALTGWTVAGLGGGGIAREIDWAPGEAGFLPAAHEPGRRTVLGRNYAEDGQQQAVAILRDLALHPSTARHIATKLARHFIADDPPAAAIERLQRAYQDSGGDLPSVYAALIDEPEVWRAQRTKIRNPWDWMVATNRAVGVERSARLAELSPGLLQQMGQSVWRVDSPAGWGDTAQDWAGSGALLTRVEIASLVARRVGNVADAAALAREVLGDALHSTTSDAIDSVTEQPLRLALLFASPEFQRR
ncbi:MAG: DUF1800 domain-containing protein [Erythrobacter sp.]|nr:MAG: DUF1800 domain-containing protein [Erythrobacter sp.]